MQSNSNDWPIEPAPGTFDSKSMKEFKKRNRLPGCGYRHAVYGENKEFCTIEDLAERDGLSPVFASDTGISIWFPKTTLRAGEKPWGMPLDSVQQMLTSMEENKDTELFTYKYLKQLFYVKTSTIV